jgi:hypothetical protein
METSKMNKLPESQSSLTDPAALLMPLGTAYVAPWHIFA